MLPFRSVDHAYGQGAVSALAKENPYAAAHNADSFQCYVTGGEC